MIFGRAVIILALSLGLGACATYYDDGVRYEDGSYYSPGDAGRGDYYYAPEPSYNRYYYDEFDRFFFVSSYYGFGSFGGGWYGSPIYSYGGYCSVRYRYCPPFGYYDPFFDPFPRFGLQISFGNRWYYPYDYGYGHGYVYRHRAPPRRRPGNPATTPAPDAGAPRAEAPDQPWIPRPVDERPRRERPRRDPMADDGAFVPDADREVIDPAVGDDAADAPVRRWRGPAPRPASATPSPARPPSAEPRRSSPPRSEGSSDGDASPRRRSRSSDRDDDGN